jgi:hypothetical protein
VFPRSALFLWSFGQDGATVVLSGGWRLAKTERFKRERTLRLHRDRIADARKRTRASEARVGSKLRR